jgi:hypothetical protein
VDDDIIFRKSVTIRSIPDRRGRFQAKDWLLSLSLRDQRRAQAGLESFDVGFASKRGYAGRLEKIKGSRNGVLELKLTRGGTRGPQLRLLGVWRAGTFFVALGLMKTSRAIKRSDVGLADDRVDAWESVRQREPPKPKRKRPS